MHKCVDSRAYAFFVQYDIRVILLIKKLLSRVELLGGNDMVQCPNCGGVLKFDIQSQQMKCSSCSSFFDPYAFEMQGAEESKEYDVTVFRCPQCGGEITSTDETAAGFCSYCGSPNVLESRISKEKRPQYIIPFKKTKKECEGAFERFIKKSIFAPKAYREAGKADSFRGIYMPYWVYDMTQTGKINVATSKSHRSGDYIITDHYQMSGMLDNFYNGVSYDASSSFADDISTEIAPYSVHDIMNFSPSYLSGFYADTADVPVNVYVNTADDLAKECTYNYLKYRSPMSQKSFDDGKDKIKNRIHTVIQRTNTAMFPVWFMAYRIRNRVAYATINGQTGKVSADVPMSIPKYFVCAGIVSAVIFALLMSFLTLTPDILLILVAILGFISALMYGSEMKKIVSQENYSEDKGMQSKIEQKRQERLRAQQGASFADSNSTYQVTQNDMRQDAKVRNKQKKEEKKNKTSAITIIMIIMVAVGFLPHIFSLLMTDMGFSTPIIGGVISGVLLIGTIISMNSARKNIRAMKEKKSFVASILSVISIFIILMILLWDPASDIIYYAAAVVAMIGIILNIVDMMLCYNLLATRPLPQFDMYKGGDDRA